VTVTAWAISDIHLSFAKPRDQTRFGEKWRDHTDRIEAAWRARIKPTDIILLPGDLSWAHHARDVRPDVAWLEALPGRKVLVRGNHDYWWKRLHQIRHEVLPDDIQAVQGSCLTIDGVLVCGTMGHLAPNDPYYQSRKHKSYQRELHWLKSALAQAQANRAPNQPVLLMMHYPPFTSDGQPNSFTEIIEQYRPEACVYGHLHFEHEWQVAVKERRGHTTYHLVTCDYLDMVPQRIWPPEDPA